MTDLEKARSLILGSCAGEPDEVTRRVVYFVGDVAVYLPNVETCSLEQLALVLQKYDYIIRPHFTYWMYSTWQVCPFSSLGRTVCGANLACEVVEDHQSMLANYVAQIPTPFVDGEGVYYELSVREWVSSRLGSLLVRIGSDVSVDWGEDDLCMGGGMPGLLLMMHLECGSLVFIPWLKRAGERLGFTDFTYVDKHGEGDVAHATEFLDVVRARWGDVEAHKDEEGEDERRRFKERMYICSQHVSGILRAIFRVDDPVIRAQ